MAITLSPGVPNVDTTATSVRRQYLVPIGHQWIRIFSLQTCYLELINASDGGSLGSAYETIPGGIPSVRRISRSEFCVTGSVALQTIEVTAS